jgi:hypothetical protein
LQFSTMGYPPPYPEDWDQASAIVLGDEARYLAETNLYVLTPQMLDVVVAAAQSLTFEDLCLLTEDDLPSASGLVILPRPLMTRLPAGGLVKNVAFAWRSPWQMPLPENMGFLGPELPAVRMSDYTSGRANQSFTRETRSTGVSLPPLLLQDVWSLPFHPSTSTQEQDRDHLMAELRRLNAAYRQEESRRKSADDENPVISDYVSGAVLDEDLDMTFSSRFLYAFWRLCEQQIATVDATAPNHSAQVVAARAGVSPDVRVVALRRVRSPARSEGEAEAHQWQHHWMVRMHKVRQWYPSLQQHKVLYRGPLIKGDRDKPLLGGDVVRGLVR